MEKKIIDGNTAASLAAYALSEVALIYPITPSSTMAENCDEWASDGKLNIFNSTLLVRELQSEAGAAGALHGAAAAGSLATTFTASQGLLLMIPNLYKIAGEGLPVVLHVAARTIATHALNIFGEHSDVYACRQTGALILSSSTVQECYDMAIISHLVAVEASLPVIHFFDGFRTSHELKSIEVLNDSEVKSLVNYEKIAEFKSNCLNSQKPFCQGTAQNPDIYFQNREASNIDYINAFGVIEKVCERYFKLTGRKYNLYQVENKADSEYCIVAMGSCVQTLKHVGKKENFSVINIHSYRPFSPEKFVAAIPANVKKIAVLDRTKEAGSLGEPLYTEICAALKQCGRDDISVVGGRYGLGGKDFKRQDAFAVYQNLKLKNPQNHFTLSINDDVTHTNLPASRYEKSSDFYEAMFYGLGSDGTVSANKNSIKIIGEETGKHIEAYFEYDSKKSGSITVSHLRFADNDFEAPYTIEEAQFIACHNDAFVNKIDMVKNLVEGGTFLLNTGVNLNNLDEFLPLKFKQSLKAKKAKLFVIDAFKVADELNLGSRINTVMQSAFFKITQIIDYEEAKQAMKDYAKKTYGKKGDEIVNANYKAIEAADDYLFEINIKNFTNSDILETDSKSDYYKKFVKPILERNGDYLKVSDFDKTGKVPTGTTADEKRDIAEHLPKFHCENCIQCNQCSFVCPHACIRPVLVDAKEMKKAPKGFETKQALQLSGLNYRMQVYPKDCTGCGSCANVCPARNKALTMEPKVDIQKQEEINFKFAQSVSEKEVNLPLNVKSSQFKKPLFEFSGACAGCGETPYLKLLTQLCGKNLIIANATGCSSIYGANSPTCPYSKSSEGCGPAWSNSLFEDNAEFGYGIYLAYKNRRRKLRSLLESFKTQLKSKEAIVIENFIEHFEELDYTRNNAEEILKIVKKYNIKEILLEKDALVKQIVWLVGGDGWAYDIGFSGLDHVMASGEDIKILVMDTEVYSNTGGQSSKATQLGAVAKFAAMGKQTAKKRLGDMMQTYKNVFVAEIAMGASLNNTLTAFDEAIKFKGPAIIIAYATCINQGLDLSRGMAEMKQAVECGYLMPYIRNPEGEEEFKLFAPEPNGKLKEFLNNEVRFKTLFKKDDKLAQTYCDELEKDIKERYTELLIKSGKNKNE